MECHWWCLYGLLFLTSQLMMSQEAFQGGCLVQTHGLLVHTQIGQFSRWILLVFSNIMFIYDTYVITFLKDTPCCLQCLALDSLLSSPSGNVERASFIYSWSIYSSNYDCCALLLWSQCCLSISPTKGVQSEETSFISLWSSSFGFSGKLLYSILTCYTR